MFMHARVYAHSMLAEKLNMTPDKAEEWIVNLIRNARLDAKIDSKEGHVVMATQVRVWGGDVCKTACVCVSCLVCVYVYAQCALPIHATALCPPGSENLRAGD